MALHLALVDQKTFRPCYRLAFLGTCIPFIAKCKIYYIPQVLKCKCSNEIILY